MAHIDFFAVHEISSMYYYSFFYSLFSGINFIFTSAQSPFNDIFINVPKNGNFEYSNTKGNIIFGESLSIENKNNWLIDRRINIYNESGIEQIVLARLLKISRDTTIPPLFVGIICMPSQSKISELMEEDTKARERLQYVRDVRRK